MGNFRGTDEVGAHVSTVMLINLPHCIFLQLNSAAQEQSLEKLSYPQLGICQAHMTESGVQEFRNSRLEKLEIWSTESELKRKDGEELVPCNC